MDSPHPFLSPQEIVDKADLDKVDMDQFNALCMAIHRALSKIPWERVEHTTLPLTDTPWDAPYTVKEQPLLTVYVPGRLKVAVFLKLKLYLKASGWGATVRTGTVPETRPDHPGESHLRTYVGLYPL